MEKGPQCVLGSKFKFVRSYVVLRTGKRYNNHTCLHGNGSVSVHEDNDRYRVEVEDMGACARLCNWTSNCTGFLLNRQKSNQKQWCYPRMKIHPENCIISNTTDLDLYVLNDTYTHITADALSAGECGATKSSRISKPLRRKKEAKRVPQVTKMKKGITEDGNDFSAAWTMLRVFAGKKYRALICLNKGSQPADTGRVPKYSWDDCISSCLHNKHCRGVKTQSSPLGGTIKSKCHHLHHHHFLPVNDITLQKCEHSSSNPHEAWKIYSIDKGTSYETNRTAGSHLVHKETK